MSNEKSFDVLSDDLISVRIADSAATKVALPELLAILSAEQRYLSFPALQLHQQQAWYCFLVQLGAIAWHRSGARSSPRAGGEWREALLELSAGADEPWCLVVSDLAKAALLQPPVPEGNLARFKSESSTPDELDVLLTAKNHDVKGARISRPAPEHWLFALLSLQTLQGYSGPKNYGIARMNGGFGSRPLVAYVPASLAWGPRFRRDLDRLRADRPGLLKDGPGYRDDGLALCWLAPWNGDDSLSLRELDPWFIEVCRRVRAQRVDGVLRVLRANSTAPRISAKELQGVTGDAWTPVENSEAKALTVSGGGFTYALTQELLLGGSFTAPSALRLDSGESGLAFEGRVLVRGQGVTEGFHLRQLLIPPRVLGWLARPDERARLGELSRDRVRVAGVVRSKVLWPSLKALLGAREGQSAGRDSRPERWTRALDAAVDAVFFERLWSDADRPNEEAQIIWQETLYGLAREQLDSAVAAVPLPSMRRYRAIAAAFDVFEACARKQLSEWYASRSSRDDGGNDEQH